MVNKVEYIVRAEYRLLIPHSAQKLTRLRLSIC